MTKKLIAGTLIAVSLCAFNVSANAGSSKGKTADNKNMHNKCSNARINMQGPGSINSNGGPYTYTVNLNGGILYSGAKWVIKKQGVTISEFPADQPVDGIAAITLYGSDFISTGLLSLYLEGVTDEGYGMIYGFRGVSVTP
jgi:hypothetical protein